MTKEARMRKDDEARMTNDERSTNAPAFAALRRGRQMTKERSERARRHSDFVIPSSLDIRHSSLAEHLIANVAQLAGLIQQIEAADRLALDTEADSLHCYREKLCLVQVSLPTGDYIVDPLADVDLAPLQLALERTEIVLHGADYDLRMLRRGLNFVAPRIFDTVIAARLLGIREFGLAALVKRYFGFELPKGSQKANWAQRPLPARMAEYAINDVRYLLPLAEELEAELDRCGRLDWLRQSCQRAIEQAAVQRVRDEDELWRISGSGSLRGREAAILRALWQWREKEAEAADRPSFHVLQNDQLLNAAVAFASGDVPDYRHFSSRRRQAFYQAAQGAMQLPDSEWPVSRRRSGRRPGSENVRAMEELRRRRDQAANELNLEPAFIAPRNTLEAIATSETRAASLLVSWQRELLGIRA
jgi:ribonuclease D